MAFIAAVVAFLALLSCAGAQAPAPAPASLQQKTPVPVRQSAPTPAPPQEAAPAPMLSVVPRQNGSPGTAAPAPTLYVGSPEGASPPEGSPGTAAPTPTFYAGSPEGASPPSSGCLDALTNLSACLDYVMAGSNLTAPEEGCCPGLAGLVESNPKCLCEMFGNSNSLGINLDMAKALKLPSVCKVSTPPLSACALLGIPVEAPDISPPGMPPVPLGEPSTAIASPPESSKSSSSFRISVTVTVSLIGLWAGVTAIF